MLIRYVLLALVCFASGIAISGGYFAFISLIGIFPKLLEKVKGARHYMLIESLLAFGATLANAVYLFDIPVRVTWLGYSVVCLTFQREKKSALRYICAGGGKTYRLPDQCCRGNVGESI